MASRPIVVSFPMTVFGTESAPMADPSTFTLSLYFTNSRPFRSR